MDSGSIPAGMRLFLWNPVPFRWIPLDSSLIPADSSGMLSFLQECEGHQKILSITTTTPQTNSDVQGFQKPQGFYPGVWRVGVRVQIFRPFKNPYPSEGSEGTDID